MTDVRTTRDVALVVTGPDDSAEVRATRDVALAVTGPDDSLEIRASRDVLLVICPATADDDLTPPDGGGTGPDGTITDGFNRVIDTGYGLFEYRLMIEGWPEEFVTVGWITHADGKDGRAVYTGLSLKGTGARRTERILMQDAKIQADAIAFRVRAVDNYDRPLQSLSNYPTPIGMLSTELGADDDTMALVGGTALVSGREYHLGTEAVRARAANAIKRHIWASLRQAHFVSDTNAARATLVYERPLTMQGRRAYLFAYGERDDGAGDGSLIWRGVVSRPPRRDRDGKTWVIDCDPITKLLMQNVAGSLDEAHPNGIYHHKYCAFAFAILYDGTTDDIQRYTGWDPDEASLITNINAMLEARRVALGITEVDPGMLVLAHSPGEPWTINVTPNATAPLSIFIGSPILGTVAAVLGGDSWTSKTGKQVYSPTSGETWYAVLDRGKKNAGYFSFLGKDDGFTYDAPPVSPLGNAAFLMQLVPWIRPYVDETSAHPQNRIYIDTDLSGSTSVAISDTYGRGIFAVTGSGAVSGVNYIEVYLPAAGAPPPGLTPDQFEDYKLMLGGFYGFLSGGTTINVVRQYEDSGSVLDFVAALKVASVEANLGDTPQITDADLTTWAFGDPVTYAEQLSRLYVFVKKHSLEEILAEECKFVLHFMRLELNGKIGLLPVPTYSEADDVDDDHVLDVDGIVTPGGGQGSWPGYEPQRDGIATTYEINDSYNFRTDDWDAKPFIFDDPNVIATHKGRGKTVLSNKPYSLVAANVPIDPALYRSLADAYLGVFGLDYTVVTLEVTIKHYRVLCGDVVRLRHHRIPAGDGTEGMVDRLGVVISRSVPIDISTGATVRLDVLVYLEPVFGYSPSAFITAKVDNGGNEWTFTCDPTNAYNIDWSSADDGKVLAAPRFADGYKVRVVRIDSDTEVSIHGTVVGTPDATAGTITIQLDSTFTPSVYDYRIAYSKNADLTAEQLKYAVSAGTALQIYDGHFARRLG